MSILGPKHGIPLLAAARMQSLAVILSAYTYDVQFWSTTAYANADGLPLMSGPLVDDHPDPGILNMALIESLPLSCVHCGTWCRCLVVICGVIM